MRGEKKHKHVKKRDHCDDKIQTHFLKNWETKE